MILLQKPFHLLNELLCIFLRFFVLGSQTEHLLVEVVLYSINSNCEALFVQLLFDFKVAFISLFIKDVLMNHVVDIGHLDLDFLCYGHYILSELLQALQSPTRSIKNSLWDEHISVTHEFFILANLIVKQVWENVTSNQAVLLNILSRHNWRFGFHGLPPIVRVAFQADALSISHLSFYVSSAYRFEQKRCNYDGLVKLTAC